MSSPDRTETTAADCWDEAARISAECGGPPPRTPRPSDTTPTTASAFAAVQTMLAQERAAGRQEGWDLALRWLRERASSHAGRWMTMDPREAIKATVEDMETLSVNG